MLLEVLPHLECTLTNEPWWDRMFGLLSQPMRVQGADMDEAASIKDAVVEAIAERMWRLIEVLDGDDGGPIAALN